MNSEPCVRFGIRISPKISENPADSRNSKPPKATLLPASRSDRFIAASRARQSGCASFETTAARSPQDDGLLLMPSKRLVILRSARRARLEGRTASIQPYRHVFTGG